MKKLLILIILFIINNNFLISQNPNLVSNPSFETYEKCPSSFTPFNKTFSLIPDWTYPTHGTPDYFNRCCKNTIVGVPRNFAGWSQPHSGDAYMGFILIGSFNKNNEQFREYLQATLTERLELNEKYCVSFYYRLSKFSKFAIDQIGVFFTDKEVRRGTENHLGFEAQVKNNPKNFLDNQDKWGKFCGYFTAQGTENHLIIGNFRNTEGTEMIKSKNYSGEKNKRGKEYSYYYIDDVSVRKITNCNDCGCLPQNLSVKIINTSTNDEASARVKVVGGTKPYSFLWSNGEKTQSISDLNTGKYSVTVTDYYNCQDNADIDIFSKERKELQVTHESSFNGKNTGKIKLNVSGGKPPYKYEWSNGKKTKDVKNLTSGEYTYKVTDSKNENISNTVKFLDENADLSDKLEAANEGENIRLKVFFDSNKSNLLDKSVEELDQLCDFMKKYNVKLVQISGHTDSQGSDIYNQSLSERRVISVRDYLTNKGIPKNKLKYIGYGEVLPVATNKTPEGRQFNRRVEFKILKK